MNSTYDVIVVGAGGVGSAAAYHLARDGRRVLLLEQFEVGHRWGSSHGGSRITRHSHPVEQAAYASLAPASFRLWRELEAESGESLLSTVGCLDVAPAGDPSLTGRLEVMERFDYPYRLLEGDGLRRAFPQFRLPGDWAALHHRDAGILSADRAVRTLVRRAVAHGVELRERTRAVRLEPDGENVQVQVEGTGVVEAIHARRAVVTAGPWAGHFFRDLGLTASMDIELTVTHQQVTYMEVAPDALPLYAPERCPVYIFLLDSHFYGFPIWERPGWVKMAIELQGPGIDLEEHRYEVDAAALARVQELAGQHLVGVRPETAVAEPCLYTLAPDRNFIVDRHPGYPQILLGAGFSGRGFKFTILTGRLLADLAASEPHDYSSPLWRDCFALARFPGRTATSRNRAQ